LVMVRDEAAVLDAAHPVRHHHGLLLRIERPVAQRLRRPRHRKAGIFRSRQARTDIVGQMRKRLVSTRVRQLIIDDAVGVRLGKGAAAAQYSSGDCSEALIAPYQFAPSADCPSSRHKSTSTPRT